MIDLGQDVHQTLLFVFFFCGYHKQAIWTNTFYEQLKTLTQLRCAIVLACSGVNPELVRRAYSGWFRGQKMSKCR